MQQVAALVLGTLAVLALIPLGGALIHRVTDGAIAVVSAIIILGSSWLYRAHGEGAVSLIASYKIKMASAGPRFRSTIRRAPCTAPFYTFVRGSTLH
jgi:hypothetical protein